MPAPSRLQDLMLLLRFGISGAVNSLLYGVLSVALTSLTGLSVLLVHMVAFIFCVPVSYALQRGFTFRHESAVRQSAPKYLLLMLILFLTGFVPIETARALEWSRLFGIAMAVAMIPLVSFIAMRLWIFR